MDRYGVEGVHYVDVEFAKDDIAEFKALSLEDGFISGLAYITMCLGPNEELARYMSNRKKNYRSGVSSLEIAHHRISNALEHLNKLFPVDKQHLAQELSDLTLMQTNLLGALKVFGSAQITDEILKPGRPADVQTRRFPGSWRGWRGR